MKRWFLTLLACMALVMVSCAGAEQNDPPKIGTVSFKTVLEKSKVGIKEQARFDSVRKQMEQTLEKKEKELNELAPKFTDEYLDSLTPEAETELKEKFKTLSQDLSQKQNEFYQTLQQEQMQVMQKILSMVSSASAALAKEKGYTLILNDEVCLYKTEQLDVSAEIIKKLDAMPDAPAPNNGTKTK